MSNSFEDVLKQYEGNTMKAYYLSNSQYNIIKQLVRIQLAELIDNDANDRVIDHFTSLDVSLTNQFNNNTINDEVDNDLPF